MNSLIVYDSYYGNTKSIALKYYESLKDDGSVISDVSKVTQEMIDESDILLVASPTRAFNMTSKIKRFIRKSKISDKYIFVFDTRMDIEKLDEKFLKSMAKRFGYAAEKIQKKLLKKGNKLLIDFKWYYCEDTEGPLSNDFEETFKKDLKNLLEVIKKIKS